MAAGVPDPETTAAVLRAIDARRDAILAMTCELIATDSATPPGDTTEVGMLIRERMATLGLGGVLDVGPDGRRRSLLWERPGDGAGPRLLLAGHLDTKPAGDLTAWLTDPLDPVIRDGMLYGLGAADMKAAVSAMVHAAAVVNDVIGSPHGTIGLVLTADEEGGMRNGAIHLVHEGLVRADAMVIGEPAGISRDWEQLAIASRGFSAFTVEVRGTQMHSSLADVMPSRNASVDLARVLPRFADLQVEAPATPLCPQGVTVNPGATLSGGSSFGTCSGLASFGVDVRFPTGVNRGAIERGVEALVEELLTEDPGLRLTWSFEAAPNDFMVPTDVSPSHPIVRAVGDACQVVLGTVPPIGTFPGATEARVYQGEAGIPTVPAFGPGCLPVCHAPNEHVRLDAIHDAARMYALLFATASLQEGPWANSVA